VDAPKKGDKYLNLAIFSQRGGRTRCISPSAATAWRNVLKKEKASPVRASRKEI
jgi:hypothetical protein